MRRGDDRAVTVQIGAVLLLAILFAALALYQINVVPEQNAEVEFTHNERVTGELIELRDTMRNAESGGDTGVPVTLGTQYETRTVAVNPQNPSGTIRTVDADSPIRIENAAVADPTLETLLADPIDTEFVQYQPHYNEYRGAPETKIEHTLLYNEFGDANVTVEQQRLVRDRQINLVVVDGNLSRTNSRTVSVDVTTLGGPGRSTLESDGDNATITIPTESPERWVDAIGLSFAAAQPHARIESTAGDEVTIELDEEQEFDLRVVKIGVGDGGTRNDAFAGSDSSPSGDDTTQGPLVIDADSPDQVVRGEQFTLTGTVTSIGTEDVVRSGTPIVGGEWESDGPDGTRTGTLDVDGNPERLENVALEDEVTTEVDTAGWETGEHTLTVWGQDASGRESSLADAASTVVEVRDAPENAPYFAVSIDDHDGTVTEGETAEFTVTVTNEGGAEGTQDIPLEIDGEGVVDQYADLTLAPDESRTFTLAWETERGDAGERDATVSSDDDEETVRVTVEEPATEIRLRVDDLSHGDRGVEFVTSAAVENQSANFDRIEVVHQSQDQGWANDESSIQSTRGSVRYQEDGAVGDEYEITVRAIDSNDGEEYVAAERTVTTTADAANPVGEDLSTASSPQLVTASISDRSNNGQGPRYRINYEVDSTAEFDSASGYLIGTTGGGADSATATSASGTINLATYGTNEEFKVTLLVTDTDGVVVDAVTEYDVADGTDP